MHEGRNGKRPPRRAVDFFKRRAGMHFALRSVATYYYHRVKFPTVGLGKPSYLDGFVVFSFGLMDSDRENI